MRECARSDGLSQRECLRELREGVADRAERLQHFGDDEGAVGKVDVHIVLHAPTHRRQPIEPNTADTSPSDRPWLEQGEQNLQPPVTAQPCSQMATARVRAEPASR